MYISADDLAKYIYRYGTITTEINNPPKSIICNKPKIPSVNAPKNVKIARKINPLDKYHDIRLIHPMLMILSNISRILNAETSSLLLSAIYTNERINNGSTTIMYIIAKKIPIPIPRFNRI